MTHSIEHSKHVETNTAIGMHICTYTCSSMVPDSRKLFDLVSALHIADTGCTSYPYSYTAAMLLAPKQYQNNFTSSASMHNALAHLTVYAHTSPMHYTLRCVCTLYDGCLVKMLIFCRSEQLGSRQYLLKQDLEMDIVNAL